MSFAHLAFNDIPLWNALLVCVTLACGYLLIRSLFGFGSGHLSSDGKAVLITGCDTGFGHDLALRLSELNYRVFAGCLFTDGEGANALKSHPGVEVLKLDVTKDEDILSAKKEVSRKLGHDVLWAVVNNAGIGTFGELEWCPTETIIKVFDVNTLGMIRVTKGFLPLLKRSKGRVVNVTSASTKVCYSGLYCYAISKVAAKHFTVYLRAEMKKWGIRVIEISPHGYKTPITNPSPLQEQLRRNWLSCKDEESEEDTGEEYFEKYDKRIVAISDFSSTRCGEVVSCMVEAIASASPKHFYEPGDIMSIISVAVLQYIPSLWIDNIMDWILPKMTLLHGKGGNN